MKENKRVLDCSCLPCRESELLALMVYDEPVQVLVLENNVEVCVNAFCIFSDILISRFFVYGWCPRERVWCSLRNFGTYDKARGYVYETSCGTDPHPEVWS